MIRVLVEILLPLLTPLALYAAWVHFDARRKGAKMPGWEEGHWFWVILLGAVLAAGSIVWFGESGHEGSGTYIPPRVEDGKVVPGHFE